MMFLLFSTLLLVGSSARSSARQLLADASFAQVGQKITNSDQGEVFEGDNVAINYDGTIIATKASSLTSGSVRTYKLDSTHSGTQWNKIGQTLSGQTGDELARGLALSQDGTRMAIGVPGFRRNVGQLRVYEYNETSDDWNIMGAAISGEVQASKNLGLGVEVAMSDDGSVVGVTDPDMNGYKGSVYVYKWSPSASEWTQVGQTLQQASLSLFGSGVSLNNDGTRIVIGGRAITGIVEVYDLVGDQWENEFAANGDDYYDRFGNDVEVAGDGKMFIIGAFTSDAPNHNEGNVYIYQENASDPTGWSRSFTVNGMNESDRAGSQVAISDNGEVFAWSSPRVEESPDEANAGYVEIWRFNPDSPDKWEKVGSVQEHLSAQALGTAMALSGDGKRIVLGAPGFNLDCEDGEETVGYTYVLELPSPTSPTGSPTSPTGSSTNEESSTPALSTNEESSAPALCITKFSVMVLSLSLSYFLCK